nr:hypothetical protein [Tanacetum cinerariifolium]
MCKGFSPPKGSLLTVKSQLGYSGSGVGRRGLMPQLSRLDTRDTNLFVTLARNITTVIAGQLAITAEGWAILRKTVGGGQLQAKVTEIEESKHLTSLSLDELIGNLIVHEMSIKKDSEKVKAKFERKSLVLKAKKESSDEECSTSGSEDEKYAMAVRDFKKFFKTREFPKPPKDKNQRAFVGGSWSDNGEEDDEKVKYETYLVAQASSE